MFKCKPVARDKANRRWCSLGIKHRVVTDATGYRGGTITSISAESSHGRGCIFRGKPFSPVEFHR